MKNNTKFIAEAGLIAALYIVLTALSMLYGGANSIFQLRLSEMLYAFCIFTPAGIPGIFLGCLISNLITGCAIWDIIFGSIASLIGAYGTWKLRNKRYIAFIPPIISNAIIVSIVLSFVYSTKYSLAVIMILLFISEFISCGILGQITYKICKKIQG